MKIVLSLLVNNLKSSNPAANLTEADYESNSISRKLISFKIVPKKHGYFTAGGIKKHKKVNILETLS